MRPFSFNPSRFQETLAHLPIGVFDSGIGGLTVLEEILTVDAFHNETFAPGPDGRPDFEDERFIYFGDQANMPYGNYSAADQTDYLRELILKDALFLLGTRYTIPGLPPRMDKPPVKALVIACNTATAYGLEDLRKMIAALKLPIFVVGVVEAGARGLMNEPGPAPSASSPRSAPAPAGPIPAPSRALAVWPVAPPPPSLNTAVLP
jgi:glutamate racemase